MHRRLPLPLHGSPTAARAGRAGRGRARAGRARAGFFFFFLLVKAKSSSSSSSSAAAAAAAAGSATPPSSASSSFGFFCRIAARRALVRPHAGTGGCTQAELCVEGRDDDVQDQSREDGAERTPLRETFLLFKVGPRTIRKEVLAVSRVGEKEGSSTSQVWEVCGDNG